VATVAKENPDMSKEELSTIFDSLMDEAIKQVMPTVNFFIYLSSIFNAYQNCWLCNGHFGPLFIKKLAFSQITYISAFCVRIVSILCNCISKIIALSPVV
jgi:hypothetical protein